MTVRSSVPQGLWLVATPIGNLDDASRRSVEVLRASSVVLCEDTRRTGSLLARLGVTGARFVVANEHTEHAASSEMLEALARRETASVVTDAGTPGISDPGERLVRAALGAGHRVHAVPGPAAFVMAATLSGFPTARIAFDGFLPRSGAARRVALTEISRERRTTVIYESPHRLARTVADLLAACGGSRRIAIARELTKLHEETWRGTLSEATAHTAEHEPRGEYCIVIEPAGTPADTASDADVAAELAARIGAGLTRRAAIDEVTEALGVPRREVYRVSNGLGPVTPGGPARADG